jgi:ABC-type polysaccharide/polyol phosphate transport system ATPase subunit
MPPAIETESLGKRYWLGERAHAPGTLRDALRLGLRRWGRPVREELWALRNVDLEIEQAEVVGVIGRNGAGKTTLLKLVARITEPTEGVARMRGRVGALLEVGTGFHFELTGRENVFFNGAVLGMSHRDIRLRFDQIVEFAGVERFLDTPLKRYSAGMYLRLAFSVAAHLEPDIVIVDEVLAVGDVEFRQKCMGRIGQLRDEGRTVLFVSHDLASVQALCRRSVLLDRGAVVADGPTPEVVQRYLASGIASASRAVLDGGVHSPVALRSVALVDEQGRPAPQPRRDRRLRIRLELEVRERMPDLDLATYLLDRRGVRVANDALSDAPNALSVGSPGRYRVVLSVEPVLAAGSYMLGVWLGTQVEEFFDGEVLSFDLQPAPDDRPARVHAPRLAQPHLSWEMSPLS